jgi:hypothetical protein
LDLYKPKPEAIPAARRMGSTVTTLEDAPSPRVAEMDHVAWNRSIAVMA